MNVAFKVTAELAFIVRVVDRKDNARCKRGEVCLLLQDEAVCGMERSKQALKDLRCREHGVGVTLCREECRVQVLHGAIDGASGGQRRPRPPIDAVAEDEEGRVLSSNDGERISHWVSRVLGSVGVAFVQGNRLTRRSVVGPVPVAHTCGGAVGNTLTSPLGINSPAMTVSQSFLRSCFNLLDNMILVATLPAPLDPPGSSALEDLIGKSRLSSG